MDMTASVRTHQILYKQQHPLREHLLEHPLSTAEQHQCTLGKLQWGDGILDLARYLIPFNWGQMMWQIFDGGQFNRDEMNQAFSWHLL